MSSTLMRAQALERLAQSAHNVDSLGEALTACCEELLGASQSHVALRLLDQYTPAESQATAEICARLRSVRVQALIGVGDYRAALHEASTVSEYTPNVSSPLRSKLKILECSALWHLGRSGEAIENLLHIRQAMLSLPDSKLLAECANNLLSAYIIEGNFTEARFYALEAIVSARRCGDLKLQALALDNFGRLEKNLCRWVGAKEAGEEALQLYTRINNQVDHNSCRRGLAIIEWKRGRISEALQMADDLISDPSVKEIAPLVRVNQLFKSAVLIHVGHFEEASRYLASGEPVDASLDHPRLRLLTEELLGDIDLEQGRFAEALHRYDSAWEMAIALVPKGDIVVELGRRRAECHLMLGDVRLAHDEAMFALSVARQISDRYEEAATYRILGLCAGELQCEEEAKDWFEQGFAYYDDIETPYEWGKLWMSYGDWLSSNGLLGGKAQEAYEAARDHFERMGAKFKLMEVETRIRTRQGDPIAKQSEPTRAPLRRRPRGGAHVEAKSQWAMAEFGIVSRDRVMLGMLDDVAKLARSKSPVLVLGESGTGKELVAHGIHRLSSRAGSFIPINCAALPREIVESELFGHVVGSFTGANRDKPGLLEVCSGGTVFLDEIGEMSVELQARLLRFLESGEVRRVGSTLPTKVETRVVAATNCDRRTLERGDGFRADLYYRLAHAVIELPPLRRRKDDINLLVQRFLREACSEEMKEVRLGRSAQERLNDYSWPGNVRQLKSVIRRLVILSSSGDCVEADQLQLDDGRAPASLIEELEEQERRRISEAMRAAQGSRAEAARALGMPRTTLINKLRRFGLG